MENIEIFERLAASHVVGLRYRPEHDVKKAPMILLLLSVIASIQYAVKYVIISIDSPELRGASGTRRKTVHRFADEYDEREHFFSPVYEGDSTCLLLHATQWSLPLKRA